MPSFADSIFLFVLALLLFGPKKLPVLARELGKWMGEFRRASNEFKMQMDEELRASEQADRQKQIVAMEAAAPIPPPLNEPAEPEHPHLRHSAIEPAPEPSMLEPQRTVSLTQDQPNVADTLLSDRHDTPPADRHPERSAQRVVEGHPYSAGGAPEAQAQPTPVSEPIAVPTLTHDGARPVPIATSGNLNMMPPATGLPTPRSSRPNALSGLVNAIPEAPANGSHAGSSASESESIAHGD